MKSAFTWGLKIARFDTAREQKVHHKTNCKANFEAAPLLYAEIWEKLNMVPSVADHKDTTKSAVKIETFLQAVHFIF
jgi:hypothetical protein